MAKKGPDNCEWMFADAGAGIWGVYSLAKFNPARWSGKISFDEGIKQLEDARKEKDRPVVVKVPSGMSSKENQFHHINEAIEFIKSVDPVRIAQKFEGEQALKDAAAQAAALEEHRADQRKVARENVEFCEGKIKEMQGFVDELSQQKGHADAAVAAAKAPDCEWMFGDKGAMARYNPLSWSNSLSFEAAVKQLEEEKAKKDRPIIVKVPSGVNSKENRLPDIGSAIDLIKNHDPKQLKLKDNEIEIALQNAMETLDDAKVQLEVRLAEQADLA